MAPSHMKQNAPFSERLYRLLLLSYPAEFHQVYSQEMVQTFRAYRSEVMQQHGKSGAGRLWSVISYDLATTVVIEHMRVLVSKWKRFFNLEGRENTTLMTQFSFNVAQHTDIGRKRESNEDNLISIIPEDSQVMANKGALFIVADGLGGHAKGEIASEIAIHTVSDVYYQEKNNDIPLALQEAMKQANKLIYSNNVGIDEDKMMGTTCVAVVLQGDRAYIANVGDSRAYIVRDGLLKQVSQDHSIVAEQLSAGIITKDQVIGHPQLNVITRCLGTGSDVEIDIFSEPVQEGDLLVLCTDGLSNLVNDEDLSRIVRQYRPEESVYQLIERANQEGGPDNITAMVIQVSLEESKEPAAEVAK